MDLKQCITCGQIKPLNAFPKLHGNPHGGTCKQCKADYRRRHYHSNREHILKQIRNKRRKNRERDNLVITRAKSIKGAADTFSVYSLDRRDERIANMCQCPHFVSVIIRGNVFCARFAVENLPDSYCQTCPLLISTENCSPGTIKKVVSILKRKLNDTNWSKWFLAKRPEIQWRGLLQALIPGSK
ncbi:MAG TPA: hypothetical protein PKL84_17630 [Candidatus Hydrogenedentes bacterium]|nr:hypothetical protein [Candidatus Hydrogenedentota bacterium]